MKTGMVKKYSLYMMIFFSSCNAFAQKDGGAPLQRVIIIRHGEKPETGENLSCQGFNRALQLADVLYKKFKLPDYIFVPSIKTGKSTAVSRMYQTITPFVVKYNLDVDTKFQVDEASQVAASILKKSGTVLVVWEHKIIPQIIQALGIKDDNFKWKADDFDSIVIITFKDGKATLSNDKENLNPPATCN